MPSRRKRPADSRGAFFCLICGPLLVAGHVVAAPSAPTVAVGVAAHDTLVVRGSPVADPVFPTASATVTVVEIDRERPAPELADLLEQVAGLQIRRYGGLGAPVLPSLRGSASGQISVLVDGLPLADAQDGAIDLSSLPLDRYERVEVYRGHVPSRFGGAGGAGAVNLVTRRGVQADDASWLQWAGSHGEAGMRLEGGHGGVHAILHARRADNGFGFRNHNQTFANPHDDYDDTRRNAWLREGGALLTGQRSLSGWRTHMAVGIYRRDAGRPGPVGGFESPQADLRLDRIDWRLSVTDPREAVSLDLDARRGDERLRDEQGDVGWDPPGVTTSRSDHLGGRLTWRFDADLAADVVCSGRIGGEWRRQRFGWRHADLVDPRRTRETTGAFAGANVFLLGPGFTLSPSLRWQRLEDDFPPLPAWPGLPETPLAAPHVQEHPSPALALAWDARPGRLRFEAHWARSFRAPTWVELFGYRGGVDGNRELKPEQIESRDLTVYWRRSDDLRLRLAWFESDVTDGILWTPNSQYTSRADNHGRLHTTGLEAEIVLDAGRLGRGWGNVTIQDTEDRGDDPIYAGHDLPYLPDLEASLGWEVEAGAWTWGARWQHESASFRDRYNTDTDRIPARSLYNLSATHVWRGDTALGGDRTGLTCEVLNLTDNDVYDVEGYPLPGRTVRVSLIFH
jgi:iron complex outermembrane recepter protein